MKQVLLTVALFVSSGIGAYSVTPEDNIVIIDGAESYEFVVSDKGIVVKTVQTHELKLPAVPKQYHRRYSTPEILRLTRLPAKVRRNTKELRRKEYSMMIPAYAVSILILMPKGKEPVQNSAAHLPIPLSLQR